ncbi:MAG: cohesin domain-containing protein, partial [Acutalibacteraceae bacterium]
MKKFLSLTIALLFAVCLIQPAASADENSVMLDISSAEAAEGGTASVSFTVSENPGITSFDIALSYDSENLIYQSCSLDGGVFSGTTFQISSGLHAVFMDSAGSSLTGKVFTAVFAFSENAKKGETYTVSASLEKTSFYSGENAV